MMRMKKKIAIRCLGFSVKKKRNQYKKGEETMVSIDTAMVIDDEDVNRMKKKDGIAFRV